MKCTLSVFVLAAIIPWALGCKMNASHSGAASVKADEQANASAAAIDLSKLQTDYLFAKTTAKTAAELWTTKSIILGHFDSGAIMADPNKGTPLMQTLFIKGWFVIDTSARENGHMVLNLLPEFSDYKMEYPVTLWADQDSAHPLILRWNSGAWDKARKLLKDPNAVPADDLNVELFSRGNYTAGKFAPTPDQLVTKMRTIFEWEQSFHDYLKTDNSVLKTGESAVDLWAVYGATAAGKEYNLILDYNAAHLFAKTSDEAAAVEYKSLVWGPVRSMNGVSGAKLNFTSASNASEHVLCEVPESGLSSASIKCGDVTVNKKDSKNWPALKQALLEQSKLPAALLQTYDHDVAPKLFDVITK